MALNANGKRTAATVRVMRMVSPHRRKRMPRAASPNLIWEEFARDIAKLVSSNVIRAAFRELLEELPSLLASAKRERGDRNEPDRDAIESCCLDDADRLLHWAARIDADEGKRARALIAKAKEKLRESVNTRTIEQLAESYADRVSKFGRVQLNRQTQAVLGVDIFTGDRGMRTRVTNFATENVSLIKGAVENELVSRIEKRVTRALTSGQLHEDLAKELNHEFGFGERRAQLIARDQIGKLHGQINASRQKDLGVTRFIWRTVGDERVRDEDDPEDNHVDRDGETYSYDDPPFGELPGEPIQCRCYAEPVLDDLLNDDEGAA